MAGTFDDKITETSSTSSTRPSTSASRFSNQNVHLTRSLRPRQTQQRKQKTKQPTNQCSNGSRQHASIQKTTTRTTSWKIRSRAAFGETLHLRTLRQTTDFGKINATNVPKEPKTKQTIPSRSEHSSKAPSEQNRQQLRADASVLTLGSRDSTTAPLELHWRKFTQTNSARTSSRTSTNNYSRRAKFTTTSIIRRTPTTLDNNIETKKFCGPANGANTETKPNHHIRVSKAAGSTLHEKIHQQTNTQHQHRHRQRPRSNLHQDLNQNQPKQNRPPKTLQHQALQTRFPKPTRSNNPRSTTLNLPR